MGAARIPGALCEGVTLDKNGDTLVAGEMAAVHCALVCGFSAFGSVGVTVIVGGGLEQERSVH